MWCTSANFISGEVQSEPTAKRNFQERLKSMPAGRSSRVLAAGLLLLLLTLARGELLVRKEESKGDRSNYSDTITVSLTKMWKSAEDTGEDLSAAVLRVTTGSRLVCESFPNDDTCNIALRDILPDTPPQNGSSRDYVDLTFTIATGSREQAVLLEKTLRVHIAAEEEEEEGALASQLRPKRLFTLNPLRRALLLAGGGAAFAGGLRGLYVQRKGFRAAVDPMLEACVEWEATAVDPVLAALARRGRRALAVLSVTVDRVKETLRGLAVLATTGAERDQIAVVSGTRKGRGRALFFFLVSTAISSALALAHLGYLTTFWSPRDPAVRHEAGRRGA